MKYRELIRFLILVSPFDIDWISTRRKKTRGATSHMPNGGFTALCKAFRPLELILGLTVESSAIRH